MNTNTSIPQIRFDATEYKYTWLPYTDTVLGGSSEAAVKRTNDNLLFFGEIKDINNVSWASLRSNMVQQNLTGFSGIEISIKGDGRKYAFEMEYNLAWQDEKAGQVFSTTENEWAVIKLPFSKFNTLKMNTVISNSIDLNKLLNIHRFNFHVADLMVGSFSLEIESICFYE